MSFKKFDNTFLLMALLTWKLGSKFNRQHAPNVTFSAKMLPDGSHSYFLKPRKDWTDFCWVTFWVILRQLLPKSSNEMFINVDTTHFHKILHIAVHKDHNDYFDWLDKIFLVLRRGTEICCTHTMLHMYITSGWTIWP